ncbi:complement regulatory protein [Cricetid gammaherpesvirus 2]|uniref:Complement regulatory protein n=1 Tax=Cricetid gammaherpesvirus 2 TaxID=1605972 RepID=E9M5J2_9GAMA|nr:complement regulatory protein [Cricetid gammaherpesvirus 2]ADW24350.1 complement regulatory protein [Cricetid gammaherpesvirus 2]ADW24432.1 complement regulatory protein [Cricetid gammaherpesvirus 2]
MFLKMIVRAAGFIYLCSNFIPCTFRSVPDNHGCDSIPFLGIITPTTNVSMPLSPGEAIRVVCRPGYRNITPNIELRCIGNNSWEMNQGCKKRHCLHPLPNLKHGQIKYVYPTNESGLVLGSYAKVTCNWGYVLSGKDLIFCLYQPSTKRVDWDAAPPSCNPRGCPIPSLSQNVSIPSENKTVYNHLDSIALECQAPQVFFGPPSITCRLGLWIPDPTGSCLQSSCTLPNISHGYVVYDNKHMRDPSSANVACYPGYALSGPINITCLSNKTWTPLPKCLPELALPPPASYRSNGTQTPNPEQPSPHVTMGTPNSGRNTSPTRIPPPLPGYQLSTSTGLRPSTSCPPMLYPSQPPTAQTIKIPQGSFYLVFLAATPIVFLLLLIGAVL